VENFVKICIDNVAFVVYNRSIIIKKGVKMTPEEIKQREEAIKKINNFPQDLEEMGKNFIKLKGN
jgi:hypothetical protein